MPELWSRKDWWAQGIWTKDPVRTIWVESRTDETKSQEAGTAGKKKKMEPEPWVKNWTMIWSRRKEAGNGWEGLGESLHTGVADNFLHVTECVGVRRTPSTELATSNEHGWWLSTFTYNGIIMGSRSEQQFWEKHHCREISGSWTWVGFIVQAVVPRRRVRTEDRSEWPPTIQEPFGHCALSSWGWEIKGIGPDLQGFCMPRRRWFGKARITGAENRGSQSRVWDEVSFASFR